MHVQNIILMGIIIISIGFIINSKLRPCLENFNNPYKQLDDNADEPDLLADLYNQPASKSTEYEFKKKTHDALKKKMSTPPAWRPNDSGDEHMGVPIKSALLLTRTGSWDAQIEPVDYKELRRKTTGLFTDTGLEKLSKSYE